MSDMADMADTTGMSTGQAATELRRSPRQVVRYVHAGLLDAVQIGDRGRYEISAGSVQALLAKSRKDGDRTSGETPRTKHG